MAKSWPIPNFNPDLPLSTCLRQVMKTRCLEFFSLNQGLSEGTAEAVHDARITLRRLLVVYSIFKGCIKKKKLKRYKVQLKSLHKLIGKVREYDVQMGLLEKYLESNASAASDALAFFQYPFITFSPFTIISPFSP